VGDPSFRMHRLCSSTNSSIFLPDVSCEAEPQLGEREFMSPNKMKVDGSSATTPFQKGISNVEDGEIYTDTIAQSLI
jgi:hypothetical protein